MRRHNFGKTPWWQHALWVLLFTLLVLGMLGRRLGPRRRSLAGGGHASAAPARR